jgi:hypothetical protein
MAALEAIRGRITYVITQSPYQYHVEPVTTDMLKAGFYTMPSKANVGRQSLSRAAEGTFLPLLSTPSKRVCP